MKNQKISEQNRVLTVIGIVLCVILVPILIVNCTLIIKSVINKDEVPTFGGMLPLIVLTDSMHPDIKSGDLIVCKTVNAEDVKLGDVISFFDPAGNGTSVVTHKVIEVINEGGKLSFRTQGTNNNTPDDLPVPAENLVGRYTGLRLPFVGKIALFMQTTAGLIVCVVVPIILLVGYDIIRRKMHDKNKTEDVDALRAELEALRAMQNAEQLRQSAAAMDNAQCTTQDQMQSEECRAQEEESEFKPLDEE